MRRLLSSVSALPVVLLAGIVVIVSVQAGCSGKSDDDCKSFRGGCRQAADDNDDDETFLEKVNPFD